MGGWALRRMLLVHGVDDPVELMNDLRRYSLAGLGLTVGAPRRFPLSQRSWTNLLLVSDSSRMSRGLLHDRCVGWPWGGGAGNSSS